MSYDKVITDYKTRILEYKNRKHESAVDKDPELRKVELRSDFYKDRDKILHSKAFRRLQGKTQVFHSDISDHFRTRLTHTLEVAQLSRTIAAQLGLFEDLAEAIALGHDVGHTPYGHAGETTLNKILSFKNKEVVILLKDILLEADYKNLENQLSKFCFKHNLHSVKVLDLLEKKSPHYDGYNLTNLTKEGILKHTDLYYKDEPFRNWGDIDLNEVNVSLDKKFYVENYETFLESQIVALSDEIAQATHDLEDGFRTQLLDYNEILNFIRDRFYPLFTDDTPKNIEEYIKHNEDKIEVMDFIIACLIYHIVTDCINFSKGNIEANYTGKIIFPHNTICLSKNYKEAVSELQGILVQKIILSEGINQMDVKAEKFITELFVNLFKYPLLLPDSSLSYFVKISGHKMLRHAKRTEKDALTYEYQKDFRFFLTIVDYVAGMTDNYLERIYNKYNLPGAI